MKNTWNPSPGTEKGGGGYSREAESVEARNFVRGWE